MDARVRGVRSKSPLRSTPREVPWDAVDVAGEEVRGGDVASHGAGGGVGAEGAELLEAGGLAGRGRRGSLDLKGVELAVSLDQEIDFVPARGTPEGQRRIFAGGTKDLDPLGDDGGLDERPVGRSGDERSIGRSGRFANLM